MKILLPLALLLAACSTPAPVILGTKPAYLGEATVEVPNSLAIGRRIWVPSLDDGYVPQGLTIGGGYLWVATYRSADPKIDKGPCRVFRVEMDSGHAAGFFDLPASCTHAGGLAWLGDGHLLLADTRELYRVDVDKALTSGTAEGATETVKLAGDLRGSFASFDGHDAWIGTWTKDPKKARIYRLHPRLFYERDGQTVDEVRGSVDSMPIPPEAQGLAFNSYGDPWVSTSNGTFGKLYHLDRQGTVLGKYDMVAGLEDIEFDAYGHLWGVSESGSKKYMHWGTHFPQIFEIDVAKLR